MIIIIVAVDGCNITSPDLAIASEMPDHVVLQLWENYTSYFKDHFTPTNSVLHDAFLITLNNWNNSIYQYYFENGSLPRIPDNYRPRYLDSDFHNSSEPFLDLMARYIQKHINKLTFNPPYATIESSIDVFWVIVLLEREVSNCENSEVDIYNVKTFLKRISMATYETHEHLDNLIRKVKKPQYRPMTEPQEDTKDELFLQAREDWEVYSKDTTNICPITENYLCNTNLDLNTTEGYPCYCAIIVVRKA